MFSLFLPRPLSPSPIWHTWTSLLGSLSLLPSIAAPHHHTVHTTPQGSNCAGTEVVTRPAADVAMRLQQLCHNFSRTGTCKFGDTCRFLHQHQPQHRSSHGADAYRGHGAAGWSASSLYDSDVDWVPPNGREVEAVLPTFKDRIWIERASHDTVQLDRSSSQFTFRLMTYNLLSDELAHEHYNELYAGTSKEYLAWRHRWSLILSELKHWNPDVICLQEVDAYNFEQMESVLADLGYEGVYAQRTGNRGDGCATFWRTSHLHAVAMEKVCMIDHNLKDNVALLVALAPGSEPASPGTSAGQLTSNDSTHPKSLVVLGNTHVLFNNKRGDVKLGQLRTALTKMRELALRVEENGSGSSGRPSSTCILCGDFNTAPGSGVYHFLSDGLLHLTHHDRRNMSGQNEGWGFKHYQRDLQAGKPGLAGYQPDHSPSSPAASPKSGATAHSTRTAAGSQQHGTHKPVRLHPSQQHPVHIRFPDHDTRPASSTPTPSPIPEPLIPVQPQLQPWDHMQSDTQFDMHNGGVKELAKSASRLDDDMDVSDSEAEQIRKKQAAAAAAAAQAAALAAQEGSGTASATASATTMASRTVVQTTAKVDEFVGPYTPAVYEPWQALEPSADISEVTTQAAAQPLIPPGSTSTTVTTVQGTLETVITAPSSGKPALYMQESFQSVQVQPAVIHAQTGGHTHGHTVSRRRVYWEEDELDAAMGRAAARQLLGALSLNQFPGRKYQQEVAYRREVKAARDKHGKQGLLVARHPLHLRSAYVEATGREPPFTTCHLRCMDAVDYIWFTPHGIHAPSHHGSAQPSGHTSHTTPNGADTSSAAANAHGAQQQKQDTHDACESGHRARPAEVLKVLRVLQVPDSTRFVVGMPNMRWPSDHVCLVADFALGSE